LNSSAKLPSALVTIVYGSSLGKLSKEQPLPAELHQSRQTRYYIAQMSKFRRGNQSLDAMLQDVAMFRDRQTSDN